MKRRLEMKSLLEVKRLSEMNLALRALLGLLLLVVAGSGMAQAHPHVWIIATS
jgi:ABC-type uncharacterized transport system substrate-binding protein